jgi:hypothetical protein
VLRARLQDLRCRIAAAGGDSDRITVIAVTKGHGVAAAVGALSAGMLDLGENYAAELLEKAASVASSCDGVASPRWHFLGRVQRNKVPRLSPVVGCWQGVSRAEEPVAIARRREGTEIFVEINTGPDANRGGCAPREAEGVVEAARRAGCAVRGLMTVAPLAAGAARSETAAEAFGTVAGLAAILGLGELSMGMSHDLEQAVAAGSTMIRVGTALFGERPPR